MTADIQVWLLRWTHAALLFATSYCVAPALYAADTLGEDDLSVFGAEVDGIDPSRLLRLHILDQAKSQWDARRADVEESLKSPEALATRLDRIRGDYRQLLGDFPERTPLQPQVTGKIECEGYTIENVVYQSRPNHYVTANLYVPTSGKGPWPGVLVLCGHSQQSKAYEAYQRATILLALNGFVALIVDPVGQGERDQFLDEEGAPLKIRKGDRSRFAWEWYYEHTLIDLGSRLVGRSTVAYEVWDNIRSIDYLLSRPETDKTKPVGCTGNSGGGTQTTFLMAIDERIGPAAPSCFVKTREGTHSHSGIDGCQLLPNEGAIGIEEADFISMRAPRPTIILAAEGDYFPIADTRITFREAQRVYNTLGFGQRVELFAYRDRHGFTKPRRQAATRWMRRWMYDDNTAVEEPEVTVQAEKDLWVTDNGQADSFFAGAMNVPQLNLKRARELAADRERFLQENNGMELISKIKQLIGMREQLDDPVVQGVARIEREDYHIEKLIIRRPLEVPMPALLFMPNKVSDEMPATLYVNGRGKHADADANGSIARLVKQGRLVLAVDLRGFGETVDRQSSKQTSDMNNDSYDTAMMAMYIGRPLLGQRVEDVITALDVLADRKDVLTDDIDIVGVGRAGPVVLHAAVLDRRFSEVTLRDSIQSWIDDVVAKPRGANLIDHVVPGVLQMYDLPDLAALLGDRFPIVEDADSAASAIK